MNEIKIISESPTVEARLSPFREKVGKDYDGYRNHIYRVLTYTLHFLGEDETQREAIETALVYHDIGLWSDAQTAYLEPSIQRVLADNQEHGWGYDEQLLRDIIYWHHKVTAFRGPHANIVNAVRKADWVDATGGRIRKGLPKAEIRRVMEAIPPSGFYETLQRIGPELSGSQVQALRDMMKVFKF